MDEQAHLRQQIAQRDHQIETLKGVIEDLHRALEEEVEGLEFAYVLSRREREVLGLLTRRNRVTRQQLYTVLYGADPDGGPGPKIIDIFIHKIRKKLCGTGIIIETIIGVGYQLSEASRELINPKPLPTPTKPVRLNGSRAGQISMFDGV